MALETRKAGTASLMAMNGITTGNVDRNTSRNTPSGAPPVVSSSSRARTGGSGSCFSRACMASSSAGCSNGRDHRRQGIREEPPRTLGIGGLAHGAEGQ